MKREAERAKMPTVTAAVLNRLHIIDRLRYPTLTHFNYNKTRQHVKRIKKKTILLFFPITRFVVLLRY